MATLTKRVDDLAKRAAPRLRRPLVVWPPGSPFARSNPTPADLAEPGVMIIDVIYDDDRDDLEVDDGHR
jgi:hypothetical protein